MQNFISVIFRDDERYAAATRRSYTRVMLADYVSFRNKSKVARRENSQRVQDTTTTTPAVVGVTENDLDGELSPRRSHVALVNKHGKGTLILSPSSPYFEIAS